MVLCSERCVAGAEKDEASKVGFFERNVCPRVASRKGCASFLCFLVFPCVSALCPRFFRAFFGVFRRFFGVFRCVFAAFSLRFRRVSARFRRVFGVFRRVFACPQRRGLSEQAGHVNGNLQARPGVRTSPRAVASGKSRKTTRPKNLPQGHFSASSFSAPAM